MKYADVTPARESAGATCWTVAIAFMWVTPVPAPAITPPTTATRSESTSGRRGDDAHAGDHPGDAARSETPGCGAGGRSPPGRRRSWPTHHRREQPRHDGLRHVDVELLVQVRRRQSEHPAGQHPARGAGRRRRRRTGRAGSRPGRGAHAGAPPTPGLGSGLRDARQRRRPGPTPARCRRTYGDTRRPRRRRRQRAADQWAEGEAHGRRQRSRQRRRRAVLLGVELPDGGGHARHHQSAADPVDDLAREQPRDPTSRAKAVELRTAEAIPAASSGRRPNRSVTGRAAPASATGPRRRRRRAA